MMIEVITLDARVCLETKKSGIIWEKRVETTSMTISKHYELEDEYWSQIRTRFPSYRTGRQLKLKQPCRL